MKESKCSCAGCNRKAEVFNLNYIINGKIVKFDLCDKCYIDFRKFSGYDYVNKNIKRWVV